VAVSAEGCGEGWIGTWQAGLAALFISAPTAR
jgi:hypothetical protein